MLHVEQMQFGAAVEIQCENLVRILVEIVLEDSRIIGCTKKQCTTVRWRSKFERIDVTACGAGSSNGRRLKQEFSLMEGFFQFSAICCRDFIRKTDLRSL
jgi:hypothetical protein